MKKYITAAALLVAGTALSDAATEVDWNSITDGTLTTYSQTFTGNYDIDLGEAAIAANSSFTLDFVCTFSAFSNYYGIGLVGATDPFDDSVFRIYLGDPNANNDVFTIKINKWDYGYGLTSQNTIVSESDRFGGIPNDGYYTVALRIALNKEDSDDFYEISSLPESDLVINGGSAYVDYNVVSASGLSTLTSSGSNYSLPEDTVTKISITNGYLAPGTNIPEPSAFGLLAGAGALALVAARRRRRAK